MGVGIGNHNVTSKPILLTAMLRQFFSLSFVKETSMDAAHGSSLLTSPVSMKFAMLTHCVI